MHLEFERSCDDVDVVVGAGAGLRKPRPGSGLRKPRSEHVVACAVDRGSCGAGGGIHSNPGTHTDEHSTDDDSEAPELVYESDTDDEAPRMPCAAAPPAAHRDKAPSTGLYNACVARPVKPAELKINEKARAAMQLEWDRLRQVERPDGTFGCWDESSVMEWSKVRRAARKAILYSAASSNVVLIAISGAFMARPKLTLFVGVPPKRGAL